MLESVAVSGHHWQGARFHFLGAAGRPMCIPWFTKLNENTEALKIKIDVLGNHRGFSFCYPSWWEPTLLLQFPIHLAGLCVHLE